MVARLVRGLRFGKRSSKLRVFIGGGLLLLLGAGTLTADVFLPNLFPFLDPTGFVATNSKGGAIDLSSNFFKSLGTNGRSCGTCHQPGDAFGLSKDNIQLRYLLTRGKDPLFASVDGANCPDGKPDHSLLLNNGLIRIPLTVPATAQYTITAVYDPTGCALVTNSQGQQVASVYRRPLATTNINFSSTLMFDGRETLQPLNNGPSFPAALNFDLTDQALNATLIHAQAAQSPTADQLADMVNFELALNSGQIYDFFAGDLTQHGAQGGPTAISKQAYYPGINDSLGGDPQGNKFNPNVFTIYNAWQNSRNPWQASVARGQQLFNTNPLTISNVPGLVTGTATLMGTCTTCHDTPNVGHHSFPLPLDIGNARSLQYETDPNIVAGMHQLSQPNAPVFQLTCTQGPQAGQVFYTSDPGKSLISGNCADIGRGKGLILRGLAARAPYFHNGSAASLKEVVNFYNQRFQIGLSAQQMQDLINFLQTL
jgi:cytochrome c peroxidase